MAKVIHFTKVGFCYYKSNNSEDEVNYLDEYVSLVDYQKLESLLKRWNGITPLLKELYTIYKYLDHLDLLIDDTYEAIKDG